MNTNPRFLLAILVLVVMLLLTGTVSAKYIPYVEPLDGDWGDIANPSPVAGGYVAALYGRLGVYGDVDVIAYEVSSVTSNWYIETVIPSCGEHSAGFSPEVALIGPGLPNPDAGALPFEVPEGMGAVVFGDQQAVEVPGWENYLFSGQVQRFAHFEMDSVLGRGDYLLAIWEPHHNTGAYVLSVAGTHPDNIDAQTAAQMENDFRLIESGAWMGQDCNAPLVVENCEPTRGQPLRSEDSETFPERFVVGEDYVLSGVVRDSTTCLPVADARIAFSMANAQGVYDGEHDGILYTNQQGAYRIQSDPPASYGPGAHVHLFISAPGYRGLATEWMLEDGTGEGNDTFDIALRPE